MTKKRNILIIILLFSSLIPLFAQQRGKASYYSKKATGARTSSGERVHHDSLTCAHRTLPFGTLLKVTNLSNNKSVVVKVIDRGPFIRGRIVDLSYGAAKALGMLSQGVANVRIEEVHEIQIPLQANNNEYIPTLNFDIAQTNYGLAGLWEDPNILEEKHLSKLQSTQPKKRPTIVKRKKKPQRARKNK